MGTFSIIYFLKRGKFNIGSTTALVIIDKLTTLLVFGIIAVLGLFLFIKTREIYLGLLIMGIILLFGVFIFLKPGRSILKCILGRYSVKFANFFSTFKNLMVHNKSKFIINIIVTLLSTIFKWLVYCNNI